MDSNSSDHSPPLSDNAGSSWIQCWENEISSISGLNLGSNSELNSLVEDKEIAAKAVAFVVNSTRKGIVPLCADVANLLRAKRSLEKKVFMLKRENEVLRSSVSLSLHTSHSTSPVPASLSSEKSTNNENSFHLQDRCRPCSRCSQCSSTVSNSPKFEKCHRQRLTNTRYSPAGSQEGHSRRQSSPNSCRSRSSGCVTQAIVHPPPPDQHAGSDCLNIHQYTVGSKRKNSLPEIVSEPNGDIKRISPLKLTKEVQCAESQSIDRSLEEKFMETVRLNSKLAEDLGTATKEIENLKGRLKELEMNQTAKNCSEQFYLENEVQCDNPSYTSLEDHLIWLNSNNSHNNKTTRQPLLGLRSLNKNSSKSNKVKTNSTLYSEPLKGCKCSACIEAVGSDDDIVQIPDLSKNTLHFTVSKHLKVQINDHVVVKGDRTGYIRYVGHMDRIGQPNLLFVGIELDAPVGRHDGFFNGKRYFYCEKDYGLFVSLHDIVCKVSEKDRELKTEEMEKNIHQTDQENR